MAMCMTAASCGSFQNNYIPGSTVFFGSEQSVQQKSWQSSKSLAKVGGSAVKSLVKVRAVGTEASPEVASRRTRRDENVDGEFYVDKSCINCDTCRWMSPTVFVENNHQSSVYHQPTTDKERFKSLQALLACPTSSIHTVNSPKDIVEAQKSFPLRIDASLPGVYHCGYHSEKGFGATTYFITRPEGNIIIDSPRFSEPLAKRLEGLGGARYMFLTHKDDVADHKKWQARFNLERVLHEDEVTPETDDVEIKLKGDGNWTLGPNTDLIFTPGHTKGHVCFLLKNEGVIFTGDHCWATPDGNMMLGLYNKHSMSQQIDSFETLIPYYFTWVLPAHGRRKQFQSVQAKNDAFIEAIAHARSSHKQ
ncbi:unnamed protein product [Calypogeia fissa]